VGHVVGGEAAGFSGAFRWAMRESSLAGDSTSVEYLRELLETLEYENMVDHQDEDMLYPVANPKDFTTKI
jgi:hypothetical protein